MCSSFKAKHWWKHIMVWIQPSMHGRPTALFHIPFHSCSFFWTLERSFPELWDLCRAMVVVLKWAGVRKDKRIKSITFLSRTEERGPISPPCSSRQPCNSCGYFSRWVLQAWTFILGVRRVFRNTEEHKKTVFHVQNGWIHISIKIIILHVCLYNCNINISEFYRFQRFFCRLVFNN